MHPRYLTGTLGFFTITKRNNMTETKYSTDNEEFTYDSISEMLDCNELNAGDSYYIAEVKTLDSKDAITYSLTLHLLDLVDEWCYNRVGEDFDSDFSKVHQEAKVQLQSLLQGWTDKHVNLSKYFLLQGMTKEMKLEQEDIE